jgi:hypothetical protein
MGKNYLESEILAKIMNGHFNQIPDFKECYKHLKAQSYELLDEAREDLERKSDLCEKTGVYTAEDIKKILRFNNCLSCSLNAFVL